MIYAILTPEQYENAQRYDWKLVYRWGTPNKPVFAAECKIEGRRVLLHRFVLGLHGDRGAGLYVLPKDGDALHVWPDNLITMTKDELSEHRAKVAAKRGNLTDEQQSWLDAECKRVGKSRWQVIGSLIDEKLGIGPDEPKAEPSEFE